MALSPERIIFSGGVSVIQTAESTYQFELGFAKPKETFQSLAQIIDRYSIKPVVAYYSSIDMTPSRVFLLSRELVPLEFQLSDLGSKLLAASEFNGETHNLLYVLRSVAYHAARLAVIEHDIVRLFHSLPLGDDKSHSGCFQTSGEQFFELDSGLVASRRAYEFIKNWIWASLVPTPGTRPRNFTHFLKTMEAKKTPCYLRLQQSWTQYGSKLTEYRDCVLHNTAIDFGITTAHMKQLPNGAWSIATLIPKNPQTKSRSRFQFETNFDAMTLIWEIANELFSLVTHVTKA